MTVRWLARVIRLARTFIFSTTVRRLILERRSRRALNFGLTSRAARLQ